MFHGIGGGFCCQFGPGCGIGCSCSATGFGHGGQMVTSPSPSPLMVDPGLGFAVVGAACGVPRGRPGVPRGVAQAECGHARE